MERTLWAAMKSLHAHGTAGRPDAELEQTFFNSVTRRVFSTVGVDDAIEYLEPAVPGSESGDVPPLYDTYTAPTADASLVRSILDAIPWSVPYAEPERDAGDRRRADPRRAPRPSRSGPGGHRRGALGVLPEQGRVRRGPGAPGSGSPCRS